MRLFSSVAVKKVRKVKAKLSGTSTTYDVEGGKPTKCASVSDVIKSLARVDGKNLPIVIFDNKSKKELLITDIEEFDDVVYIEVG